MPATAVSPVTRPRHVAIVGGSVAGLATALVLAARNHSVAVFERRAADAHAGGGFVLWPDALQVLDQLGLSDAVTALGEPILAMDRFDAAGQPLGSTDLSTLARPAVRPARAVLRGDLQALLTAHARRLGVELHHDCEVVEFQSTEHGTKLALADGQSVQAEFVVGADGRMHSAARRHVAPAAMPVYQGFINWIGVTRSPTPRFTPGRILDYWGIGQRFGLVPVSPTVAYWAAGLASPGSAEPSPKYDLIDLFATWPDEVPRLLAEANRADIAEVYVHDLDPLPCWHRGNVLLLGDAAHAALPTSGRGASEALCDAWELGQTLDQHVELNTAFAAFTAKRQPAVTALAQRAREIAARLFNADPEFCRERDRIARQAH